jgi:hypothetical protein
MIQKAIKNGEGYQHFHHTSYVIALAYALLNQREPALAWLQRTAGEGFPCYPMFEKESFLNNLRQDPRFLQFMAEQKKQWEYFREHL